MEVETGWVEMLLQKNMRDKSIARVLSVERKAASEKGDNYTSEMIRLKMRVVLGSGEITNRSVIVKRLPVDKGQRKLAEHFPIFKIEIEVYSRILPCMKKFMDKNGDTRDTLWCECLGHSEGELLLLEDLQERGYRIADRHQGQNLTHATMVLRALGRFHAMSHILSLEGDLNADQFGDYMLCRDDGVINNFFRSGFCTLIEVMKTSWGSEWAETTSKMERFMTTFGPKLLELVKIDEDKFNVMNHGDCWTNNMMFQYDQDTNAPLRVKFVDFQICHKNSFGWDLVYFFHSSVQPGVRYAHQDELLEVYRQSLLTTMNMYERDTGKVPSLEEIKEEISRLAPLALVLDVSVLPITMAAPEDAMDMEKLMDNNQDSVSHNRNMFTHANYTKALQRDLKFFMTTGIL